MADNITRIIMCGSRTWKDRTIIRNEFARLFAAYGSSLVVMHGDEPNGADEHIRQECEEAAIRHIIYCADKPRHNSHRLCKVVQVADWNTDGKSAGPKRNKVMRDDGRYVARGCVAFRDNGKSNGTDGMMRLCLDVGIPVLMYSPNGKRTVMDLGLVDIASGKDLL